MAPFLRVFGSFQDAEHLVQKEMTDRILELAGFFSGSATSKDERNLFFVLIKDCL